MAQRRCKWWPDTCGCGLRLERDDATTDPDICIEILASCTRHVAISDPAARLTAVTADNNLKNEVREFVIANTAILRANYTDVHGIPYTDFPAGVDMDWLFDLSSNLTISFRGIVLTNPQRNQMRTALDTRFGAGRVNVG